MLIKTVVDDAFEGAKTYKSYCLANDAGEFQNVELCLAKIEYDEKFVENLSNIISGYYIHTKFTFDYESSGDAGDGRDEYYTEEKDLQIALGECIIKDGQFFGVVCESFECESFVLVDHTKAIVNHPGNYGGRNYHFYRDMQFVLISK